MKAPTHLKSLNWVFGQCKWQVHQSTYILVRRQAYWSEACGEGQGSGPFPVNRVSRAQGLLAGSVLPVRVFS